MLEPIVPPYESLAPAISDGTLDLHYDLYLGYVKRVAESGDFPNLDAAIRRAVDDSNLPLLHNAQQAQNHEVYFQGMRPDGGGLPSGPLLELFKRRWKDEDAFREAFIAAAMGLFGSGWLWLAYDGDGVGLVQCPNSDQPWQLGRDLVPLLAFDVWEHAYVCDYGGARGTYALAYLERLVDWRGVEQRLLYADALLTGAFT